jgi:hypothetical protein
MLKKLLLWVNDELSFDRFNKNAASLYRLTPTSDNGEGSNVWDNTPGPIAVYAKKEVRVWAKWVFGGVCLPDHAVVVGVWRRGCYYAGESGQEFAGRLMLITAAG